MSSGFFAEDFDTVIDQFLEVQLTLAPDVSDQRFVPLFFVGPEIVGSVEGINLAPETEFYMAIHPSGRMLYLDAEQIEESFLNLRFAINDEINRLGYIFELGNFSLPDGSDLILLIDRDYDPFVFAFNEAFEDGVRVLDQGDFRLSVTIIDPSTEN